MLIGIPGSGKSTWAKTQNCQVLSSDEFRRLLSGDETNQNIHHQVFAAMRHLLRARMEIGQPATILDATNLRWSDRRPWLQVAKKFDARAEAVFFNVPLALALERNRLRERQVPEDVIRQMHKLMQVPTMAEGFDDVKTISS